MYVAQAPQAPQARPTTTDPEGLVESRNHAERVRTLKGEPPSSSAPWQVGNRVLVKVEPAEPEDEEPEDDEDELEPRATLYILDFDPVHVNDIIALSSEDRTTLARELCDAVESSTAHALVKQKHEPLVSVITRHYGSGYDAEEDDLEFLGPGPAPESWTMHLTERQRAQRRRQTGVGVGLEYDERPEGRTPLSGDVGSACVKVKVVLIDADGMDGLAMYGSGIMTVPVVGKQGTVWSFGWTCG